MADSIKNSKTILRSHGHYKLTKGTSHRFWKKPLYRIAKQIIDIKTSKTCESGSLVFGAPSKYISVGASEDWAVGTGDFCIDWWQYQTLASPPPYSRLFQIGDWPNHSLAVSIENGSFLAWVSNQTGYYGRIQLSNYLNQWVYFAFVRYNGIVSVYQNGTRILNVSAPNNVSNNTDVLKIGEGSGNYWNGNLTNFRFVKGYSVYDANQTSITVPSGPLSNTPGTKLLLLAKNAGSYLLDSSNSNKTVANNGSVTWSSSFPDAICPSKPITTDIFGLMTEQGNYIQTESSNIIRID